MGYTSVQVPLAEEKVHLLYQHAGLVLAKEAEVNDAIFKHFTFVQKEAETFTDGCFSNSGHSYYSCHSVLQHTRNYLLHFYLASDELVYLGNFKWENWLVGQIFNLAIWERSQERAFMLFNCLWLGDHYDVISFIIKFYIFSFAPVPAPCLSDYCLSYDLLFLIHVLKDF